jgi:hypothetical protein
MKSSRWLLWLLLLLIIVLMRPSGLWQELKRMWAQRELLLRVLVVMIGIYFLYGLYSMYQRGMLPWW